MKAIVIRLASNGLGEIVEEEIGKTLKDMHVLVKGFIEVVHKFKNGDVLVANEDGRRLFAENRIKHGFTMQIEDGIEYSFYGNAFVVSVKNGDFANHKSKLSDINSIVEMFHMKAVNNKIELVELKLKDSK